MAKLRRLSTTRPADDDDVAAPATTGTADWGGLNAELRDVLGDALAGLIDGAADDVDRYVAAIAQDLVRAAANDRPDLVAELRGQLRLIGEINRVRASDAAWDTAEQIIAAVFRAAVAGLARGIVGR